MEEKEVKAGAIKILGHLARQASTVAELSQLFDVSYHTIAHHLHRLRRFGQVTFTTDTEKHNTSRISGLDGLPVKIPVKTKTWTITAKGAERLTRRADKANEQNQELSGLRERVTELETQLEGAAESSPLSDYQDAFSLDGILEGPVALQRVVHADDVSDITKRIDPDEIRVEKKFDGWLVQVVNGRIYSRRGIELTKNFLPIAAAVRKLSGDHLIGELVYWDLDGVMDESKVTSIAGTDDPVQAARKLSALPGRFQIMAFDLIGHDGKDISGQPFIRRREALEETVTAGKSIGLSPIFSFAKWKKAYDEAINEGGEGVVMKNVQAPYYWRELGQREPAPLGVTYKLKVEASDDFIAIRTTHAEKGRLLIHYGQIWKGRVVIIGKVDGLSAEMEHEAEEKIAEGPQVIELSFQSRYPGFPGTLRNPRWKRWRPDKPMESVLLPAKHAPG